MEDFKIVDGSFHIMNRPVSCCKLLWRLGCRDATRTLMLQTACFVFIVPLHAGAVLVGRKFSATQF